MGGRLTPVPELEARYYRNHIDDHQVFDATVRDYLRSDMTILDAGAGRGLRYPYDYGAIVEHVVGVDTDPEVAHNPNVDRAVVADLSRLPFDDATFDLVFSKYVVEHLTRPLTTFRELRRVMRPGAHLVFHTPNRFHYVAVGAMVTPTRFHVWFNARRGRVQEDTFPTRYRANDRKRLRQLAADAGFRVTALELIEPKPDYLSFHPFAYRAGIVYERVVNRSPRLVDLRCVIVADLEAV